MAGITANPLKHLVIYDECDCEGPITEDKFLARASLEDGVSGQMPIDTTFENTDVDMVNRPRSDFNSLDPEGDADKPWRDWPNKGRGQ